MPPKRDSKSRSGSLGDLGGKAIDFITNLAKGEADDYLGLLSGVVGPWLKMFALNAAVQMKSFASRGHPCEAQTVQQGHRRCCDQTAVVGCAACGRKTCIYHAFLTWKGDALCWHCVDHTVHQMAFAPPPPPPPHSNAPPGWNRPPGTPPPGHGVHPGGHHRSAEDQAKRAQMEAEIDRSLVILGLDRKASWDDVNKAFRAYVQRNHPDKVEPPHKATAEAQFKQVSAAYNFLNGIGWGKSGQESRPS